MTSLSLQMILMSFDKAKLVINLYFFFLTINIIFDNLNKETYKFERMKGLLK